MVVTFDWKIEIGLNLAHYSGMYCYNVIVLNINLCLYDLIG